MPSIRSLNRTSREGGTNGGERAPTRSNETDAAAEIGVVQRKLFADKIIGGGGAKIMDCRGGMPDGAKSI
jgi:hypothetical protein